MPAIAHDYKTLQSKYGVNFVRARAFQVKSNAIVLKDGTKVLSDRAEVSLGIDIRYDKILEILKKWYLIYGKQVPKRFSFKDN